ncbi:MAG TPA: hypothetical protein VFI78_01610 [Salinimicrobium sp.]|nr:hypothetical protein [Salinimicrobium sp.]
MERIVIEVADETAEKWQKVSPKLRSSLEKSFEQQIQRIVENSKNVDFETLLTQIREEAEQNGLTEEILQEILKEDA